MEFVVGLSTASGQSRGSRQQFLHWNAKAIG
jgi:hypothetical protein